jgi:anti-sigma-K factor RskA
MSTADRDWWLTEAGEYVLGTLRGSERDLFEKILERDPEAQAHVDFWEAQFAPLELSLQRIEKSKHPIKAVPDSVWQNIALTVQNVEQNREALKLNENAPELSRKPDLGLDQSSHTISDLIPPKIQLRRWRALAGLSMAASLIMGVMFWQQQAATVGLPSDVITASNDSGYNIISVLRSEDGTDLWAIFAETATGEIKAVALDAPAESLDRSHQLWVVLPDNAGVRSVGLLPYGNGNVGVFDSNESTDQSILTTGSAFAVSLEPYGGTDTPAPTGPVIGVREFTLLNDEI